ncbi:MAG: peptidylprolyl isomerase [Bacteroidetes bacterium]|nr:peptidylprolyl isomerase [Bacteroidota bacterium]
MKFRNSILPSLLILTLLVNVFVVQSCKDDTADPGPMDTLVKINTSFGDMICYMYKGTPRHRANFHKLAQEGFYDSTEFHRVVKNFVIQGGDPLSKDNNRTNDGQGGPGYTIPAEIDTPRYTHILGAIGAARTSDQVNPERASSGSQFYIVVSEEGCKNLNGAYTVFGRVLKGQDVVNTIVSQPASLSNRPDTRIPMFMSLMVLPVRQIKSDYGFDVE